MNGPDLRCICCTYWADNSKSTDFHALIMQSYYATLLCNRIMQHNYATLSCDCLLDCSWLNLSPLIITTCTHSVLFKATFFKGCAVKFSFTDCVSAKVQNNFSGTHTRSIVLYLPTVCYTVWWACPSLETGSGAGFPEVGLGALAHLEREREERPDGPKWCGTL